MWFFPSGTALGKALEKAQTSLALLAICMAIPPESLATFMGVPSLRAHTHTHSRNCSTTCTCASQERVYYDAIHCNAKSCIEAEARVLASEPSPPQRKYRSARHMRQAAQQLSVGETERRARRREESVARCAPELWGGGG